MSQNLTFAGTAFSAYSVPGTHTAYGGAAIQYAADGTSIYLPNTDSFLQLVDNEICVGLCSAESVANWNNTFPGNEFGLCFIDSSQTGFSLIVTPTLIRLRNEVAGSPGSTISQISLATTGAADIEFRVGVDLSTGEVTVFKDDVSVLTGTYTGATTGLRAGLQIYHASDNPIHAYRTLTTVTSTTAKTIVSINGGAGVRVGSTGNTINTLNMGALTSLTIGGKAMTNLAGNTFDAPPFVDGQVYALIGNKTAVASDSGGSASRSTQLLPPLDWSVQTLGAPLNTTSSVITGLTPAAQVGEQILIDAENGLITPQGVYQGDIDGTFQAVRIRLDGTVDIYNVHTVAPTTDTAPNAFGFNTPALAALGATVTSTNTTITGINAAAAVSVTGGLVSINGGAFVTSGTITSGQTIAARVTASNSYSTAVTATVNIGGATAQFTATTIAAPPDTTPNSFSITPVTGAALSTQITSASVTPVGYSAASALTVTGGTASINGGAFSASPGNISPGQSFVVRLASSAAYSTQASATASIGGVSAQFLVTTIADPGPGPDTTPDSILFPANTNCIPSSAQSSAVRTITGINTASPITAATNCTYSVAGGAATSANGSISNGQTIQLFAVASGTPDATVSASITIGGQVFTWEITTAAEAQPATENRLRSNIGALGKPTKKRIYKMAKPQTPSKKGLTQASSEHDRTLNIDLDKCDTFKMIAGVEKSAGATGTVEIWAHEVTASNFALVDSINLAVITEKDYTPLEGPFDMLRAVPVGVSGSFNFSCVAY